jgi:hydroxymethylpyrimidine/phosphomethylpyrimidine kinase
MKFMKGIYPCCLTIAGSDSGGNAGVQADLRTFHAYKLHGCTVFTALTAQNPNGVYAIENVAADFVASQLDAVLGTYSIAALKTGMLSSYDVVAKVAEKIKLYPEIKKVVDPVMVATSGAKLSGDSARRAMEEFLFPLATVITPNIPEAEVLSGRAIESADDVRDIAKILYDKFGAAVLIKGGHALRNAEHAEDILFDGEDFTSFSLPWIENPVSTHGTGCTLSAALASEMALGRNLKEAVTGAKEYVHRAIEKSYFVGDDCGVLH